MKKPSIKQLLCGILFFTSLGVFAQPANDGCNTAQNLGSLPSPAACPSGVGSTINVSGSNINATAATPYTYLLGCSTGGNQPSPALDVWYSFVASGSRVTINITGGFPALASPAITLWTGNNCNNLAGVGCDNNGTAGGTNSATFEPLATGQTYYIQVSGMNSTATGNFNMALNASNDCADCNTISSLTVSPLPTYGTYAPGTQVTFCYTISNWVQVSWNWVHGIIPTFGNGWNLSTLQSSGTPPPTSTGTIPGYAWFFANGPLGQGWWVDLNPTGPANFDGNFANNFGWPVASGAGTWTWCWTIQTNSSCGQGTNLNMSINTTSDGETGNWTSPACLDDPNYNFSAILNCCLPPTLTATDVLCNGASTGSITATPTSGASPWDFVWTNASGVIIGSTMNVTSNTLSNLPAGVYNVTVTDNAGCVSTAQRTITQPTLLTAASSATTILCNGGSSTVTVTAAGGTGPYTGTGTFTVTAGTYNYTVTGANGCTATTTITVAQPTLLTAASSATTILCNGGSSTVTVTAAGGTGPYTGAGTFTVTAGTYTYTVTDASGCTATTTVTVTQPPLLTASSSATPILCNGGTSTVTVTAAGGTGPYTGAGTFTVTAGTYNYTVTDASGCTATTSVTVTQPTLLTASSSATPILCNGGTSTVTVAAAGGTGSFTGTGTFTVTAGTYTYTVTDASGCTATTTVTITQPPLITASSSATPILCNGGTSTVTVTAAGGTGPYTGAGTFTVTAGTYNYTVTDANGCTSTVTITIAEPAPIVLPAITYN